MYSVPKSKKPDSTKNDSRFIHNANADVNTMGTAGRENNSFVTMTQNTHVYYY